MFFRFSHSRRVFGSVAMVISFFQSITACTAGRTIVTVGDVSPRLRRLDPLSRAGSAHGAVTATLTQLPRLPASSRGEAPRLPPVAIPVLIVHRRVVGLEDEVDVHD